jgi:RNA polymerase sigma-70 factor, ECF subfamily
VDEREASVVRPQPPRADTDGFACFYAAEYSGTLRVAYALCGSWPVAEEVTQEAFLRALGRWGEVSGMARADAWVRRVACNLATSRLRRVGAEARALARLARRRPDQVDTPLAGSSDRFWSLVRGLPRRQAQIVALHYAEDRSVADIATTLDLAEGTVKAHLHAARRRLAARLGTDDAEGG